ncbi:MAG: hypothetical protein Q9163_005697 [Psora crenata]
MATNGTVPAETEGALIEWVSRARYIGYIDEGSFGGTLPYNKPSDHSRRQNCKPLNFGPSSKMIKADSCAVQYIHDRIQECLDKRKRSYKLFTQDDLQRMAADHPSPYIAKAGYGPQCIVTMRAHITSKFLRMILLVILDSPRLTELVAAIQALPEPTQQVVGTIMQEMVDWDHGPSLEIDEEALHHTHYGSSPEGRISLNPDPRAEVLQLEEQYAKIMSQFEKRNMEYADLETEFQAVSDSLSRAQETNVSVHEAPASNIADFLQDALKAQVIERDDQLRKQRLMKSDREQSSARDLESKISQQEEVIASHEAQLAASESHVAELQRENNKLCASTEALQKLQDEFDVMKLELEKQTRKANTADKYVQKLQASQNIEKERDFFRQELDGARNAVGATEKIRKENIALQKSNDEASRALSQIEQENEELRMTKKQLRVNYDSLAQQVAALNERFAQDQEIIAELRDRQGGSLVPASPTVANTGLEGELLESSMHETRMQACRIILWWIRVLTHARKTRLAELEKRDQQLSSDTSEKDAKLLALKRQLDNAHNVTTELHTQLQKSREEYITLQTSLTQVQQGHPIEGYVRSNPDGLRYAHNCQSTEVFKRMREHVKTADARQAKLEDELSALREQLEAAHNDRMSSSDNHYLLSNLNIDLLIESIESVVGNDKPDQVDKSKSQNLAETTGTHAIYNTAKGQNGLPPAELGQETDRNQVNDRNPESLSKEELLRILKASSLENSIETRSDAIFKKMDDGRERLARKGEVNHQISSSDAAFDFVSLSENVRRPNSDEYSQIDQQDALTKDIILQVGRQAASKVFGGEFKANPEDRIYIQNLERELKLMASAYHDLAGRLQMSSVTLQRRADAPKSWLGRQRRAMEGPTGLAR